MHFGLSSPLRRKTLGRVSRKGTSITEKLKDRLYLRLPVQRHRGPPRTRGGYLQTRDSGPAFGADVRLLLYHPGEPYEPPLNGPASQVVQLGVAPLHGCHDPDSASPTERRTPGKNCPVRFLERPPQAGLLGSNYDDSQAVAFPMTIATIRAIIVYDNEPVQYHSARSVRPPDGIAIQHRIPRAGSQPALGCIILHHPSATAASGGRGLPDRTPCFREGSRPRATCLLAPFHRPKKPRSAGI